MSSTIKKVVKLSYEQYHDLITTGKTTDKDGNEHIYDSTGETSYNVYGYDELMALNNKIDKNIIEKNKVHPNYFNWLKIEDECAKIQKDNNEYRSDGSKLSFIAIRGYLTNGATIKATPSNTNTNGFGNVYLNGTKLTEDYTYNGDGVEYVSVVIFDNESNSKFGILKSEFEIECSFEMAIYNYYHNPVVPNEMLLNCTYFVSYNYAPTGLISAPNELKILGSNSFIGNLQKGLKLNKVVYERETINTYAIVFAPYDTSAYTLDLSKVKYIQGADRYNDNIRANANVILKDLVTIRAGYQNSVFTKLNYLEIPSGVTSIIGTGQGGSTVFYMIGTLVLHCKNATFDSYWAFGSGTTSLQLEDGWNTSLNCASFKSLPLDNFKDIIKNKLADRTGQEALIFTVPKGDTYFNVLNTELCDVEGYTDKTWVEYATEVKNWTIQGG